MGTRLGLVNPDALDYLQRIGASPFARAVEAPISAVPPHARRVIRVSGISVATKGETPRGDREHAIATENVLSGLAGSGIPVAMVIQGTPAGAAFYLGVWDTTQSASALDDSKAMLETALMASYPEVNLVDADLQPFTGPLAGLVLGVPTPPMPTLEDDGGGVDRLLRAMRGHTWSVTILARPLPESFIAALAREVINEARLVTAAELTEAAPSPLAKHYTELLTATLSSLTLGQSVGVWRTAVYLVGDRAGYPALSAAWRTIFSGRESIPEPIRVFDRADAVGLAARWALPDAPEMPGPGGYRHPFGCQSVLTSGQLAACFQLPRQEAPGFSVHLARAFDVVPGSSSAGGLGVGAVLHQGTATGITYTLPSASLVRHAFVAGVTGSGKTNTIKHLLLQAHASGIPFLVIEPAKREYRQLMLQEGLGATLAIFTPGQETVAPFRLNPFEVPVGIRVAEHIDLLKAAFAAGFGMWTPLPQVLEQSLYEIYEDRGWDLRAGTNGRLAANDDRFAAFPTVTDLLRKVEQVVPMLGYEDRVTGDIRAALQTRLDALRRGGRGAMLDVARSFPMDSILGGPAVLELEGIADDDDKALLMAMLLIRLVEHRRAQGERPDLQHLLVIEEAHRLLASVPPRSDNESADPRGQAVATFANLLSEVRAYGQGVIVADQIPVRLEPDVVKNTGLKIAHRIVAGDDRAALAAAMAMSEPQARALTTLELGCAAVFGDGDDVPILVQVPPIHDSGVQVEDAAVVARMTAWRAGMGADSLLLPRPFCQETCKGQPEACLWARRLVDDASVRSVIGRILLSTIEEPVALDRLWSDLVSTIRARRPPNMDEEVLLRAFVGHATAWYADHRGTQYGWTFGKAQELMDALRAALLEKTANPRGNLTDSKTRAKLSAIAIKLHARTYPPYWACDTVCDQHPSVCMYRGAVEDLVRTGRYQATWVAADAQDSSPDGGGRQKTLHVCEDAAYELIEFPSKVEYAVEVNERFKHAARRVSLCFEQQMLAQDASKLPARSRQVIEEVLAEAGIVSQTNEHQVGPSQAKQTAALSAGTEED